MVEQRQGLRRCLDAIREMISFVISGCDDEIPLLYDGGENVIICDNRTLHDLYQYGYLRTSSRRKCRSCCLSLREGLRLRIKRPREVPCFDRFHVEGMSISEASTQR